MGGLLCSGVMGGLLCSGVMGGLLCSGVMGVVCTYVQTLAYVVGFHIFQRNP